MRYILRQNFFYAGQLKNESPVCITGIRFCNPTSCFVNEILVLKVKRPYEVLLFTKIEHNDVCKAEKSVQKPEVN